jgi:hypothetical protein
MPAGCHGRRLRTLRLGYDLLRKPPDGPDHLVDDNIAGHDAPDDYNRSYPHDDDIYSATGSADNTCRHVREGGGAHIRCRLRPG